MVVSACYFFDFVLGHWCEIVELSEIINVGFHAYFSEEK